MNLLITGAGRGLGFCLVKEALRRGHRPIAAVREFAPGPLKDLEHAEGEGRMHLLQMDVSAPLSVRQAAEEAQRLLPGIDGIINNAGILVGREADIETVRVSDIQRCMEVNAYGPIRVVQAFLPLLKRGRAQGKCILNVSSESGSCTGTRPDDYPYCISKGALNMASEKMRLNLAPLGIRVMAVHPGWMRTDMGGPRAREDPAHAAGQLLDLMEGRVQVSAEPAIIDACGERLPL